MRPFGTGSTTENWAALATDTPLCDEGTLVATGAIDAVTVEPCTAVDGRLTAVWTSWITPARLSTFAPMYSPAEGA